MNCDTPIYKDPQASVEDRVADLVSRMTLEEKVNQMLLGNGYEELNKWID